MSPLMQRILEEKALRRKRLMELPYPAKVRIVEELRLAARGIRAAAEKQPAQREEAPACGSRKP